CIHEVVWGEHGTARLVRDDRVKIVGKTGTAFPVEKGQYNAAKRRFAFAGFFPYEEPKYSCMVLVQGAAGLSANRTSGQVMKQIALKMHARGMLAATPKLKMTAGGERPTVSATTSHDTEKIATAIGHPIKKLTPKKEYPSGKVPDVTGFDLRSAIRLLESRGLNVNVEGAGRVTRQSIPAGSQVNRGQKIILTLGI
ncbi:MAG: PASTA domain-containing protein, partial [Muribaculaceae bacterium]|nr:PASTA domain-containing protein [Muribaculaceae bacterium]